ncbi:single-stranded-DNA-specific exonuclease RecJ [Lusitaniella coriacea]|uniref:single-stranded-DNA-specific exonuclease RecJ n=1 Tax=Lusitaniella coriacea TaxID=1983105 RepID=UPI003CF72060
MKHQLPDQRWQIAPSQPEKVDRLVQATGFSRLIAQVMVNRGIDCPELAQVYVEPESEVLPEPLEAFPDLAKSVELIQDAIAEKEKIAICGDYDADGMTSTALLIRALRHLGANVDYAIPSRMKDGYGINKRIVKTFARENVGLILTVDNGISAYEPIALAIELGLSVIITDHHDLPEKLPPADAILNPKLIPESSPYRGLAGVGVAYILAITLAQNLDSIEGMTNPLLELFTLGTIADLAPLTGVNRRWLKRGLQRLPKSEIPGIKALMQMSGVNDKQKNVKPDDIGFRLGPRINAIGRIGDPQVVIELLSTEEEGLALERAMQCEQVNRERQDLCKQITFDAITAIEQNQEIEGSPYNWQQRRVLVLVQPNWHHGVIGIVASRLVERYGVPVFIGTYEEESAEKIRGSARGIPEFNIFDALNFCDDLLGKYGGHKAAGGFSLPSENLEAFQKRLSEFAHQCLKPEHLKPLIKVDAQADLDLLHRDFYKQIDSLHPWGIGNSEPVFWTENARVLEQKIIGESHLKLTVGQEIEGKVITMKAIAWRWRDYFPLPNCLDIAYKLRENHWNGNTNIELEIVGVKANLMAVPPVQNKAIFDYNGRSYLCNFLENANELRIRNPQGKVLSIQRGKRNGLLGTSREDAQEIDVTRSPYYQIIKAAVAALKI